MNRRIRTPASRAAALWRIRLSRTALGAAVSLLLAASSLGAQQAQLQRVRQALTPEAAAQVESIASRARRNGVPEALLYRKALEGAAKGVSPDRIVRAVEQYSVQLGQAGQLLGGRRHAESLAAAAEALRRGVPPGIVREVGRSRARNIAIPLVVLGELTEAGVPPRKAAGMVRSLSNGGNADRLLAASAAVKRRIRQGEAPGKAIDSVRERLNQRRARPSGREIRARPNADGKRNPGGQPDGRAEPRRPTPGTAAPGDVPRGDRRPPQRKPPQGRPRDAPRGDRQAPAAGRRQPARTPRARARQPG